MLEIANNAISTISTGYTLQGRFTNSFGSGTCTADGTIIQQWTCGAGTNQQWAFR